MTLRKYVARFNRFVEEHPEALDLELIYCVDNKGGTFDNVHYGPTLGKWKVYENEINAVCLN